MAIDVVQSNVDTGRCVPAQTVRRQQPAMITDTISARRETVTSPADRH
jgi:hypothetical protein